MNAFDYYKNAFTQKYADFSGRARRSEYWYFTLFNFLMAVIVGIIDGIIGYPILTILYVLAIIIPGMAMAVRRLHDTGKSGWYLLIGLIPLIGTIILIVFYVTDSDSGENQYGLNPKNEHALNDGIIDHLVE